TPLRAYRTPKVSRTSERARRRRERRARINLELNEAKSMVDEPTTHTEANKADQDKPTLPIIAEAALSNFPAAASESKKQDAPKKRNYSKYVVWPIVA